jgi:alkylation response protein AidB-like acyl-CoA dehydrogenase
MTDVTIAAAPALTSLSEEEELFRATVREFAESEVRPHVSEMDEAAQFRPELITKFFELGLMGIEIPERLGGAGGSIFLATLAIEELARVDASAAIYVDVHNTLVNNAVGRWANDEQKARYFPRLASELLGAFALSEPASGSDAFALETKAERVDGGWSLTGRKQWISLGNRAALALVFAQTDPALDHRGLAAFLVPTESDGFTSGEIHGKLGLRASDTAELSLDGVEVGDEALMGDIGDGFKVAMSALDSGRFSVASGCVGICQGCVNASVEYAKEREQFGRPIASFQLVQQMIADMVVDTEAARALVWRAGWLKDTGQPNTTETSMAKLYATEAALECANKAIQVHGGSGYVDDYPVERYLRDARVTTLYEGTSQIHKLIIGRAATGVNAMTP